MYFLYGPVYWRGRLGVPAARVCAKALPEKKKSDLYTLLRFFIFSL